MISKSSMALIISFLLILFLQCQDTKTWTEAWEEGFETYQPSDKIMEALEIKEDMVVAEIGAGNGRLAVRIANKIGHAGKVFANDIDPTALTFMQKRIKKENIKNMFVIEGEVTHPRFPLNALDLVYIVNTYEYLADPVLLLKNTIPSLKLNGILVIISTDPVKINYSHAQATPKETIINEAGLAGFSFIKMLTFLPKDNIYFFQVNSPTL